MNLFTIEYARACCAGEHGYGRSPKALADGEDATTAMMEMEHLSAAK